MKRALKNVIENSVNKNVYIEKVRAGSHNLFIQLLL